MTNPDRQRSPILIGLAFGLAWIVLVNAIWAVLMAYHQLGGSDPWQSSFQVALAVTAVILAGLTVPALASHGLRVAMPAALLAVGSVYWIVAMTASNFGDDIGVARPLGLALLICPAAYPGAVALFELGARGATIGSLIVAALLAGYGPLVQAMQETGRENAAARQARIVPDLHFVTHRPARALPGQRLKQAYVVESELPGIRSPQLVLVYGRRAGERGEISVVQSGAMDVDASRCGLPAGGRPIYNRIAVSRAKRAKAGCAVVARSADGMSIYADAARERPREVFLERSGTAITVRAPDRGATLARYRTIVDSLREQRPGETVRLLRAVRVSDTALERQGLATYMPTQLPRGVRAGRSHVTAGPDAMHVELSYEAPGPPRETNTALRLRLRPNQGAFRPPTRCIKSRIDYTIEAPSSCPLLATTHNGREIHVVRDAGGEAMYYTALIAKTIVIADGSLEGAHHRELSRREIVALFASLRRHDTDALVRHGRLRLR